MSASLQVESFQTKNDRQSNKLLETATSISKPHVDEKGRSLRLWESEDGKIFGSVFSSSEKIQLIGSDRILNGMDRTPCDEKTLQMLAKFPQSSWKLLYSDQKKALILFPCLVAGGKNESECYFPDKPGQLRHIFDAKKEHRGHFTQDTPGNRKLIKEMCEDFKCKMTSHDGRGNAIYTKKLNDGRQLWAKVRPDGRIDQAGRHFEGQHRYWVPRYARHGDENLKRPPTKGKLVFFPYPKGSSTGKPGPNTANTANFKQTLQQTKLTESYNSTHQSNPVSAKGGTGGEIGGVACGVEYIEGFFDSPESLLGEEHYFALPQLEGGQIPFTNEELRQILRELAVGIYAHSTVPFFSLHFTQEGSDLYPVIHPAYENTLVGRVISMLDYWMKGYLNGGVFSEKFVDEWHENPNWKTRGDSALQELIGLEEYCQQHLQQADKHYESARSLEHKCTHSSLLHLIGGTLHQALTGQSSALSKFDGFRNSFRILGKQKSFQKDGPVFFIDTDFDVKYTIEPSPEYKIELEKAQRKDGQAPSSHLAMIQIYEVMAERIHDHMVKLPFCKQYFAMLGVINFFSSYFSTLKKHRKIPRLSGMQVTNKKGCPPLFPHLPLTSFSKESLKINIHEAYEAFLKNHKEELKHYVQDLANAILYKNFLTENAAKFDDQKLENLKTNLKNEVTQNVFSKCSKPFRRVLQKTSAVEQQLEKIASEISSDVLNDFVKGVAKFIGGNKSKLQYSNRYSIDYSQVLKNPLENETHPLLLDPQNQGHGLALPYETTILPSELSADELERNKRVVGGCGMILKKQALLPFSPVASQLHQSNIKQMLSMDTEAWQKVSMGNHQKGWMFRLEYETVPTWVADDFTWIEDFLFPGEKKEVETAEKRTSIVAAMEKGDQEGFSTLIDGVADLKKLKNNYGATLLHEAAKIENPFFLNQLREKGLSLKGTDDFGCLPVHYAAMAGSEQTLKRILEINPQFLNAKNKNKMTPLIVAIQHHQKNAVRALLSKNSSPTTLTNGYTDLHCCLHEGNREIIDALLEKDAIVSSSINVCSEEGGTPLMLACELDDAKLVQKLIQKGANPSAKRKDGVTAIEIAIRRNCLEVLEELLKHAKLSILAIEAAAKEGSLEIVQYLDREKAFQNFVSSCKDTPLHIALRHANLRIAEHLMKYKEWQNQKNIEGYTPFQLAVFISAWDIAKALFQKGAEVDLPCMLRTEYHPYLKEIFESVHLNPTELQDLLVIAAEVGNHLAITQVLQPKGAKLEQLKGPKGWGILHYLARSDGIFPFRQELRKTSNVLHPLKKEGNKTLPYIAAEYQSERVLRFLLEKMKENNVSLEKHYKNRHLFYAIVASGNLETVKMTIEIFGKSLVKVLLSEQGVTAAHVAAQRGDAEILEYLKSQGADLLVQDIQGQTPLHNAMRTGHEESIAFLIGQEVSIDAQVLYQAAALEIPTAEKIWSHIAATKPQQQVLDAALFQAVQNHNEAAFTTLLRKGATFSYATEDGWTPLLLASKTGQASLVEAMIQAPFDPRKKNGENPLHLACANDQISCIKPLLQKGYSPDEPNGKGKTPKELAKKYPAILEILEKKLHCTLAVMKEFERALYQEDVGSLQKILDQLPWDQNIQIHSSLSSIWGTPVHLLARFGKSFDMLKCIPSNKKLGKFVPSLNAPDSQGNSLAHYYRFIPRIRELEGLNFNCSNFQGQRPIHFAAQDASPEDLKILLKILPREEINRPDHLGKTPIFYAIEGKKKENIEILFQHGATLNVQDDKLVTPLLVACKQGSLAIVKTLLEAGSDPNQKGTFAKVPPLIFSIGNKDSEITRLLLFYGAKFQQLNDEGDHVIHLAAAIGDVEMLHFCLARGVSPDLESSNKRTPQQIAATFGHLDFLNALDTFEATRTSSSDSLPPLFCAGASANPDTLQWFLNKGHNVEEKMEEGADLLSFAANSPAAPLMLKLLEPYRLSQKPASVLSAILEAIKQDNPDALAHLYRKGVSPASDILHGEKGLHIASRVGAVQCTAWLLQNGANPFLTNQEEQIPLELSVTNDSAEQFQMLLEEMDPPIEQQYRNGQTLIHMAAEKGKLKHLAILMQYNPSFNVKDFHGFTPLDLAAQRGNVEVVRFLLACGGTYSIKITNDLDPKIKVLLQKSHTYQKESLQGETPLHFAVRNHCPLAVFILSQFYEVDEPNIEGMTPLHLAVQSGQIESTLRLLHADADPEAKDSKGHAPLWFAKEITDSILRAKFKKILTK